MNIFLPFPNNIIKSVASLDDRRLIKQILECKQIYTVGSQICADPNRKFGYCKHPVIQHYKNYLDFAIVYACSCCDEYSRRFEKNHSFMSFFYNLRETLPQKTNNNLYQEKTYIPLYVSGSKPNQIYETDQEIVGKLFQEKLLKKWETDILKNHSPKWTNCPKIKFFKEK